LTTIVKNILRFLGFDRAVTFGILARTWGLFSGPVTMLVIATGLSPVQQGFYFTFSSLLALQTFFDLGLMFVLAQFASHEFVNLSWGRNGTLEGEPLALKRFTDLLCKTVLWFGVAALLMMTVLIPAGLIFFGQKGNVDFQWRLPWVLAVVGTALNLFVMPFFALIMGSGDVVTVNKRELVAVVLSSLLCWSVIGLHGGLYAAFAVNLGALVISWGYLLTRRPEFVKLAWRGWFGEERKVRKAPGGLSWWGEIWPMQWRMAVSSGSAYFIFQLFNPVLFQYHGSVIAGQMGMTLTAANALLAGSMTVVNAKTPEFGKLIAVHDWDGLDRLFFRVTRHALLLVLLGSVVGFIAIWQLQEHFAIGRRFIPAGQAALLLGTVCFQSMAGSFATYLRAHKQEPLMRMTILASMLQGAGTWYLGKHYASLGVTAGFFAVTAFFILPYVLFVWRRCRQEWHMC
jgi:O-antigen/teichoic acid export membrane protein